MDALLVHGLGRTPVSLFGLAAALRRSGFRTHFFGYSPTLESLPCIVRRLTRRVELLTRHCPTPTLIGHSLGGVLLRLALANVLACRGCRLVTLGSPVVSPVLARAAWQWRWFRLLAGDCGALLAEPAAMAALPFINCETTVIVGTGGHRGRFSPFGDAANDGVVALEEAWVAGAVMLPVWHTVMMDDARVRIAVRGEPGA